MVSDEEMEIPTEGRRRRGSAQKLPAIVSLPISGKDSSRISSSRMSSFMGNESSDNEDMGENVKIKKVKRSYNADSRRRAKEPGIVIRERFVNVQKQKKRTPIGRGVHQKKRRLLEIVESESDEDYYYNSESSSDETVEDQRQCDDRPRKKINKAGRRKEVSETSRTVVKDDISSDEDDVTLRTSVRETLIQPTEVKPYYRCNMYKLLEDLRGLNLREVHLDALRRTPFWYFIEAALDMDLAERDTYKKCDFTLADIVRLYVNNTVDGIHGFQLGEVVRCPTREDFEFTFGVRDGLLPITKGPIGIYAFVGRCWPERGHVHFDVIKGTIMPVLRAKIALDDDDEYAAEDVARLVHLYLLATIFMPNNNYRVGWTALKYLDNFDKICRYDWCTFILKALFKDLQTKGSTVKITNCSIFLMFWLCEVCPFITPRPGGVDFPRFRKWSLVEMKSAFAELNLDTLDTDFILRKKFLAKKRELKMMDSKYPLPIHRRKAESMVIDRGGSCSHPSEKVHYPQQDDSPNHEKNRHRPEKGGAGVQETLNAEGDAALNVGNDGTGSVRSMGIDKSLGGDDYSTVPTQSDSMDIDHTANKFSWQKLLHSGDGSYVDGKKCNLKDMSDTEQMVPEQGKVEVSDNHFRDNELEKLYVEQKEKVVALQAENEELKQMIASIKGKHDVVQEKNQTERILAEHDAVVEKLTSDLAIMAKRLEKSEIIHTAVTASMQRRIDGLSGVDKDLQSLKDRFEKCCEEKNTLDTENSALAMHETELMDANVDLHKQIKVKDEELSNLRSLVRHYESKPAQVNTILTPSTRRGPLVDYPMSPADASPFVMSRSPGDSNLTPLKPSNLFSVNDGGDISPSPNSAMKPPMQQLVKPATEKGGTPIYSSPSKVKKTFNTATAVVGPEWNTPEAVLDLNPREEAIINSDSPVTDAVRLARKSEKTVHDSVKKANTSMESAIPVEGVPTTLVMRKMRLNRKTDAAKLVPIPVINWFAQKFLIMEASSTILTVNTSSLSAQLRLEDIELIINHNRFNDSIIDCWALLLVMDICGRQNVKETRTNIGRKPFIFSSCVWQYVARFNVLSNYSNAAISFIDKKMTAAVKHDSWIIPINTSGDKCPLTYAGDHWTLLHYSISNNRWTFYNSMAPSLDQDVHYQRATILMDYIESSLKAYAAATGLVFPICLGRSTNARDCNMPQQSRNSLDCGPIVCYMIEMLIHGKQSQQRNWTHAAAGEYRSHMVEYFQNAILRSSAAL